MNLCIRHKPVIIVLLSLFIGIGSSSAKEEAHEWVKNRLDSKVKKKLIRRYKGHSKGEISLKIALNWLSRQQEEDGSWKREPGENQFHIGITSLCLMAFYAAGHTEEHGDHQETVKKGINYLLTQVEKKDDKNCYFDLNYGTAMMLTVFNEHLLFGLKNPKVKAAAEKLTNYFLNCFNGKGWRYSSHAHVGDGEQDFSVTAWVSLALRLSVCAELDAVKRFQEEKLEEKLVHYLYDMVDESRGVVHYDTPGRGSSYVHFGWAFMFVKKLMDSEAKKNFVLNNSKTSTDYLKGGRNYKFQGYFNEKRSTDLYGAYWGTLGLFQYQGKVWKTWNANMAQWILVKQHKKKAKSKDKEDIYGSWDPEKNTKIGDDGGRVTTTAMNAMNLTVYYRYPLFKKK